MSQALVIAKVNLLCDDGKFETGESKIESDLRSVAACFPCVEIDKFLSCEAAWEGCGTPAISLKFFRIREIGRASCRERV
jgi:hypothetical protein